MKRSVKIALATSALAVAGGLFLVGSSFAERGFGPGGMGRWAAHGGAMGGFGEMRREMLKEVDTNSDGKISQDEINAAVNARFAEFDADKNGSLSLQEFEALWADITKPIAVRTFQFLDPNGDAEISKAELETGSATSSLSSTATTTACSRPPTGRSTSARVTVARVTVAVRADGGSHGPQDHGPRTTAAPHPLNKDRGRDRQPAPLRSR